MNDDLEKKPLKELEQLKERLEKTIEEKTKNRKAECFERFEAIADEYGLTVSEVVCEYITCGEPSRTTPRDVPTSIKNNLKRLAPQGLYNPNAPKGQAWWRKPPDGERWNRMPPWLSQEITLLQERINSSRVPEEELRRLAERFPPAADDSA